MDTNATGTLLVHTVAANRSNYTNCDYSCAVVARQLQQIMGCPSTQTYYLQIVEKNLCPNCPITRQDIMAAEDIFGPDVGSLKGKTAPSHVRAHLLS